MTRDSGDFLDLQAPFRRDARPQGKRRLGKAELRSKPRKKAALGAEKVDAVHPANISGGNIDQQDANINPIYSEPTDNNFMDLGTIIRRGRERVGLKQSDLASRIYVKQSAISQWETNKAVPNLENRIQLAAALNIPLSDLLPEAGDVPADAMQHPRIRRLIQNYLSLSMQQREAIDLVVERLREANDQGR